MIHLTPEVQRLIDQALSEDLTFNDPTTAGIIPADLKGFGVIRSKADGVLAGVEIALAVFSRVDPRLRTEALVEDGTALAPGDSIARVEGSAASILRAERPALNFLQRMSGIATDTARYVKVVEGLTAKIVDTRKTAPGLRYLDKYAVTAGGGANHRLNLADGILIKDNHIAALRSRGLSLKEVVSLALERASHTIKVEVEGHQSGGASGGIGSRGARNHAGQHDPESDARGSGNGEGQGCHRGFGGHQPGDGEGRGGDGR